MAERISVRPAFPEGTSPGGLRLYAIYEGNRRAPKTRVFIHRVAMDMAQKYAFARRLGYEPADAAFVAAGMAHYAHQIAAQG